MKPLKVVIADEDSTFRESLRRSLVSESAATVLGEACNALAAVKLTQDLRPDMLLVDLQLSSDSHFQRLRSPAPGPSLVRLVFMLSHNDRHRIVDAFRFGADGLLLKNPDKAAFAANVRNLLKGHYWLGSERGTFLVEALRELLTDGGGTNSTQTYGLTSRELEIISKIACGRTNREVGDEFSISERTVKHHLTNIFAKIGVSTRLELAMFAVKYRLIENYGPKEGAGARSCPSNGFSRLSRSGRLNKTDNRQIHVVVR